jgi:deoxyribose-phosphate aldolase
MHSDIASHLDYTLLEPSATLKQLEQLCEEAITNNYAAICIPPLFVKKAKELVAGSNVKVATVIGYSWGYSAIEAKLAEIILAMVDAADELEVCVNSTALKNDDWQYLAKEISHILPVVKSKGKTLKLLVNIDMLSVDELIKCCDLYGAAGVSFISLLSADSSLSNRIKSVKLVRSCLADAVKIKADGSFLELPELAELLNAGADRISRAFTVK